QPPSYGWKTLPAAARRPRLGAKRDKRVEIQRILDDLSGTLDEWLERWMFTRLHQAQMARWQLQHFIAMDAAENRAIVQRSPEQGLVPGARHPVQDDAQSPVCCTFEALHECADRLCHVAAIDDQH